METPVLVIDPLSKTNEEDGDGLSTIPAAVIAATAEVIAAAETISAVAISSSLAAVADTAASTLLTTSTTETAVQQAATLAALWSATSLVAFQPQQQVVDLNQFSIKIPTDNSDCFALQRTLDQLDDCLLVLENSLGTLSSSCILASIAGPPGFWARELVHGWQSCEQMDLYETICDTRMPSLLPSPNTALRVYRSVRDTIAQRLRYLQNSDDKKAVCMCFTEWNHCDALPSIINQKMEQLMVEEASEFLKVQFPDVESINSWNTGYGGQQHGDSSPQPIYHEPVSVKLLTDRDTFLHYMTSALLSANHSVQIATSYVFFQDPAHDYILHQVLPEVARRGVKVHLLIDLLTIESATLRSLFRVNEKKKSSTEVDGTGATMPSFVDCLPKGSPVYGSRTHSSAHSFLTDLLKLQSAQFEIRFWCARDRKAGYRIKNHIKCMTADGQFAIFGGSNLCPIERTATADLDCLVTGPMAATVSGHFATMWNALGAEASIDNMESIPCNPLLHQMVNTWTEQSARVAILRSTPSVAGEDAIYRVVLNRIEQAAESVTISMGHACFSQSVQDSLVRAACARGVQVQILVNSYHSSDLRTGQGDLFRSLKSLLMSSSSKIKVYATAPMEDGRRPEFVHAKYVVIDGKWTALGSWNLWTRSAFYEMELEAFVESVSVARHLQQKFASDSEKYATVLQTAKDCEPEGGFCPSGCDLCRGFGPFIQ